MITSHVIVILLLATIVVLFARSLVRRDAVEASELQAIADRWHGHVDRAGLFTYGEVMFAIDGAPARLHFSKRDQHHRNFHLSIQFPDPNLQLELYSAGDLKQLLGVHDLVPATRDFAEAFVIISKNPEHERAYLTDHAQAAILAFAREPVGFAPEVQLEIRDGVLRVTRHSPTDMTPNLLQLVIYFEALYRVLISSREVQLESKDNSWNSAAATHCQVCGEQLETNIVTCSSCRTPHHLDCWRYVGACSVYGCGETRYSQPAGPLRKPPGRNSQTTRS